MDRLHVATLNILNLADRWHERLGLILPDFAALQPDLVGLQEVVYTMQQDRIIGAAGEGHYAVVRGWAGRPEYGNAMLLKQPLHPTELDRLDLGLDRSIHRALVALPNGATVLFAVTHLHHIEAEAAERLQQTIRLLAWLEQAPAHDAMVVVGDFNADPSEPTYSRMLGGGFRSAYREQHGAEPSITWPSGLQAPGMDLDGSPRCLDYIWIRGTVEVESARLAFDRPDPEDTTLYPSDHLGLESWLRIG